jgi:hypothetical protein
MAAATLELGAALNNTLATQPGCRVFRLILHRMGAMLIGVLVSAVLHGITLVQAYYYFASKIVFCHILVI